MGNLSLGLKYGVNLAKKWIGKGTKSAVKIPKTVPSEIPHMKRTLTDPITGKCIGLEREITLAGGKNGLARIDYLGPNERKLTIFNKDNFPFLSETKTITREPGGSVFGGDKITINKVKAEHWSYRENILLSKEYSEGRLLHKELDFTHSSGNGLSDYARKASMDNVYKEHPLLSGYKDMLTRPFDTVGVQHSLTQSNGYIETNYGKFNIKGTNYQNVVEAKNAAKQARIAEAEAAKVAAKKAEQEAEQEAAAKLAASRPKVNTGKMFGRNIEDLKCIVEKKADGSIVRRYFDPYASNSKSNPLITTIDSGNWHKEIIYDPRNGRSIKYKQFGTNEPDIEMTKGFQYKYTSKYNNGAKSRYDNQQYNDGLNFVESMGGDYYSAKRIVTRNPHSPELQAQRGEAEYIAFPNNNTTTFAQNNALMERLNEIKKDMVKNNVDLMDLFRPYKA